MSSLALSCVVFGCVLGAALVAMAIRRLLPTSHLNADSKEVLKLGMGLIATLAALVLGLLIATAKGTYDTQSGAINELSANYILLDRVLVRHGDDAKESRELLKKVVENVIQRMWPPDDSPANLAPGGDGKVSLDVLFEKVTELTPKTDVQRDMRSRAQGIMADIAQTRLRLFSRADSSLPLPLLVVMVTWLATLFAGYGLLAPGNATVVAVLIVCMLSVSGAVFLMLELSTPFAGIMRVSSDPLRHALSLLGQ